MFGLLQQHAVTVPLLLRYPRITAILRFHKQVLISLTLRLILAGKKLYVGLFLFQDPRRFQFARLAMVAQFLTVTTW
jgi:hypothetical protein